MHWIRSRWKINTDRFLLTRFRVPPPAFLFTKTSPVSTFRSFPIFILYSGLPLKSFAPILMRSIEMKNWGRHFLPLPSLPPFSLLQEIEEKYENVKSGKKTKNSEKIGGWAKRAGKNKREPLFPPTKERMTYYEWFLRLL